MSIFKYLFVLGRPASGKSEFIDFMKKISDSARAHKFHIGKFEEVDDFPWIWDACQTDDAREAKGEKRLYSAQTPEGYTLLDMKYRGKQMHKFNEVIEAKYMSRPEFFNEGTLLIEFARGKGDGFYDSLRQIDKKILKDAAILFIDVSFDESYRKNNARFKKDAAGSILFHKVPDRDMYEYFIENDWKEITGGKGSGLLKVEGIDVPFVTMPNEPESTDPKVLEPRFGNALAKLWGLAQGR